MSNDSGSLFQKIEKARRCLEPLVGRRGGSRSGDPRIQEAVSDVSAAMEEISIAAEVIQEQHEELAEVIAQQRIARELVDAERRRYQELFESAPGGYIATDLDGTIQNANQAAARLLGIESRFLAGKPLLLYVAAGWHTTFLGHLDRLRREERPVAIDMPLQPRGLPAIAARVSVTAARDAQGRMTGLLWLAQDTGARAGKTSRWEESDKSEAMGRLAGGVAHNFNNLLTVILGAADSMARALGPAHPAAQDARTLNEAAGCATALTQQLLAFGRLQRLDRHLVDLNAIVEELAPRLQAMAGDTVRIETALRPGVRLTEADREQVQQVLVNLALHARDAMPAGGRVTIRTEDLVVDRALAAAFSVTPGEYVGLTVSDTGEGMDAETRSRVFEPFPSNDPLDFRGGLGLAGTYGAVAQHGGFIEVQSHPGKGTVFSVRLPAARGREADSAQRSGREVGRASPTILLVEEREDVRQVTERILAGQGYEVLAACSAVDALKLSDERKGHIHLMLTETAMRGMNGRDLADMIGLARPGMKVLYMWEFPDLRNTVTAAPPPDSQLISKPFTAASLVSRVRDSLAERGRSASA